MSSIFRRKLVIGGAVLAAVAVGGGAYAATQSNTNPRQAFLNDVAKRLNVSPRQLHSALTSAALDQLNAAVKAGKLTQAQANALGREIQEHGGLPFIAPGGPGRFGLHRGFLRPFPGRPGGPGMVAPIVAGPLGAAASYLGMTPQQLFKQLTSGKSLAQVAQSQHKSAAGLQKAMVAAVKARLDKAVSAKVITSAQEQRILSHIPAIINRKIARSGYGPRFGFFRGNAPGRAWRPGAGGPPMPPPGPASLAVGPPPVTY